MSSWMNDAAAVPNHNGAGFNQLNDPNLGAAMLDPTAFMTNNTAFDAQFQNPHLQQPQQQQRMQNGAMRNASPAFNNPVYQTNPVVPSKRPRPREDSLGTSPRQTPGMLPNSRSQTPQQAAYPGFQPSHTPQPNPYQHLQHNGTGNASPSPIMANQMRPGAVPQRVSTASPHPFSPAGQQQFAAQPSPSTSEHGSRVDTPQNNPYMQNPNFAPNYAQNFTPPPNRATPHPVTMAPSQMTQSNMQPVQMFPQQQQQQQQQPPPQQAQQQPQPPSQQAGQPQPPQGGGQPGQRPQPTMEQQKMMYQMRMQQQQRMAQAQGQSRAPNMPQNMNQMGKPPMNMPNGQPGFGMSPQPGQQVPQAASRVISNPEAFMKNLSMFMQSRGLPLDPNPMIGDRPVNLTGLYMIVGKFGGYKKVCEMNHWSEVAQALQFNPQNQAVAPHLKSIYEKNLAMFEEVVMGQRHQKMQAQAATMAGTKMNPAKPMAAQGQMQPSPHAMQPGQRPMGQQMMPHQQVMSTPTKQMAPAAHAQPAAVNGFSTPQHPQMPPQLPQQVPPSAPGRRSVEGTPTVNGAFAMPSPASVGKQASLPAASPHAETDLKVSLASRDDGVELGTEFNPRVREMDSWGGVNCAALEHLGTQLIMNKPNIPAVAEMGIVDLHALIMSIQSGIHSEMRMALDTLATLTVEPRLQLDLRACEDLVDTLIDCAELQLDLLAEHATEESDEIDLPSYEDVVRGCRADSELLSDILLVGSLEYDLARAADRLICVTTILRNLSFYETNHPLLADELVVKFFCVVIRYLGTRQMLLRTHANMLDFMKDTIILLSNLAQTIEIPEREQAVSLLHFLLAFAPGPLPHVSGSAHLMFAPYDPAVHRYLPPAVDSLAKLLARDEPNRTFYKAIFAADATSSPPHHLLTRSLGLAIAPLPDQKMDKRGLLPVVEARKPYLMQGMLAADILSNLAPGPESNVARSWLTSEDGFAQTLYKLVILLCSEQTHQQMPHARGQAAAAARIIEDEALQHILLGGIAVLRRLAEKSRSLDEPHRKVPFDGLPTKESVLGALLARLPRPDMNREVLKQLCSYAALDL